MALNVPTHIPDDREAALLRAAVTPFPSVAAAGDAIASVFDSFGSDPGVRVLLIGDGSHGTSEFYAMRAEITKYMIQHHGFNIVAVEADWPDAEAVDRYVRRRGTGPGPKKGKGGKVAAVKKDDEDGETMRDPVPEMPGEHVEQEPREPPFLRFPTWMWRNTEFRAFVEWLRGWNHDKEMHDAVGFYGLDLYSLGASMRAVIKYLDQVDKPMADMARKGYEKLMVWSEHPQEYGLHTIVSGFKGYEKDVLKILKDLLSKRLEYSAAHWNGIEFHSAEQNARLVRDAEHYYKAMYYARDESWNLRDTHMFSTLTRILKHRGPDSRAIVWAHNSHVGDARATSMGWSRQEINIGQLCKEAFGPGGALNIGCMTYTGTVAAAHHWDGDMQHMKVRPGMKDSYEELMHATGVKNFVLDLRKGKCDDELRTALRKRRLERFIGVIYRPDTERLSHYSLACLPDQFDGVVWFDVTSPVGTHEVHQPHTPFEFDETWPFGL